MFFLLKMCQTALLRVKRPNINGDFALVDKQTNILTCVAPDNDDSGGDDNDDRKQARARVRSQRPLRAARLKVDRQLLSAARAPRRLSRPTTRRSFAAILVARATVAAHPPTRRPPPPLQRSRSALYAMRATTSLRWQRATAAAAAACLHACAFLECRRVDDAPIEVAGAARDRRRRRRHSRDRDSLSSDHCDSIGETNERSRAATVALPRCRNRLHDQRASSVRAPIRGRDGGGKRAPRSLVCAGASISRMSHLAHEHWRFFPSFLFFCCRAAPARPRSPPLPSRAHLFDRLARARALRGAAVVVATAAAFAPAGRGNLCECSGSLAGLSYAAPSSFARSRPLAPIDRWRVHTRAHARARARAPHVLALTAKTTTTAAASCERQKSVAATPPPSFSPLRRRFAVLPPLVDAKRRQKHDTFEAALLVTFRERSILRLCFRFKYTRGGGGNDDARMRSLFLSVADLCGRRRRISD